MASVHASQEKLVFACQTCDRRFAQRYRLVLHEKSHVSYEERPFHCPQCPARFATSNRLQTHQKQVHPSTVQLSETKLCPQCGIILNSTTSYNAHW